MNYKDFIERSRILSNHGNNKILHYRDHFNDLIIKIFNSGFYERQIREIYFLEYLEKKNPQLKIPKIIDYSIEKKFTVFNYIESTNINFKCDNFLLQVFINFINNINSFDIKSYKYKAIDSAFNSEQHIDNLRKRIFKYKNLVRKNISFEFELDLLCKYENFLNKYIVKSKNLFNTNIAEIILSPSDFGVHNLIQNKDSFYFIDFEFSGIDDPSKLICDFFLHPQNDFDLKSLDFFCSELFFMNKNIKTRVKLLYPIYIIKWITILINYIDESNISKKKAIINDFNFEKYRNNQLSKINYYDDILKEYL